jgi:hypothetical protein
MSLNTAIPTEMLQAPKPFKSYYDRLEPRQNPLPNQKLAHSLIFSNQSKRGPHCTLPARLLPWAARIESQNASHLDIDFDRSQYPR